MLCEARQITGSAQGSGHANARHIDVIGLGDNHLAHEQPMRVHAARARAHTRAELVARGGILQGTPHPRGTVLLDDEPVVTVEREGAGSLCEPGGLIDGNEALVEGCQLAVQLESVQLCHGKITSRENGWEAVHPHSIALSAARGLPPRESVERATS